MSQKVSPRLGTRQVCDDNPKGIYRDLMLISNTKKGLNLDSEY